VSNQGGRIKQLRKLKGEEEEVKNLFGILHTDFVLFAYLPQIWR
jgi:hypothetical protein